MGYSEGVRKNETPKETTMSKTSKALVVVTAAAAVCFGLALTVTSAWAVSGVALLLVGRLVCKAEAELSR
jgi:hypothetical protein